MWTQPPSFWQRSGHEDTDAIKQLSSVLMISSIIRLLSLGQTPPVGVDSRERLHVRVCVFICTCKRRNMDTPCQRHRKQHTRPPFLSQCYICAQSTVTEWFMELFGHVTDAELQRNVALCNKPAFLVPKKVRGNHLLWQLVITTVRVNVCYIATSQTCQLNLHL